MSIRRVDLADINFTDGQAIAFHFRWDRLCLLLQEYILKINSIRDAEKRITDHNVLEQNRQRRRYIIAFLIIFFISMNHVDDYVSVMDHLPQKDSSNGGVFFLITLIMFALTRSRHSETYENFQNAEINQLNLQIRSIELEWSSISGGLSLHTYKNDCDDSKPLWYGPSADPDFVELKTSVAERCLRSGDYQLDLSLNKVTWVRV